MFIIRLNTKNHKTKKFDSFDELPLSKKKKEYLEIYYSVRVKNYIYYYSLMKKY